MMPLVRGAAWALLLAWLGARAALLRVSALHTPPVLPGRHGARALPRGGVCAQRGLREADRRARGNSSDDARPAVWYAFSAYEPCGDMFRNSRRPPWSA